MPIPFTIHPSRTVPASGIDEVRWTVMICRTGAWPGWRWLDWLGDSFAWESGGALGVVPLLLELTTVPSRLARWTSYRVRRRREWDVLVFAGVQADHRPRLAVLRETCPDRRAAATRAEDLWTHLAGGGTPTD